MSYRAGMYGFETSDRDPELVCDGCGKARPVTYRNGLPTRWLLNRKAAPGWTFDGSKAMRRDWCQSCAMRIHAGGRP